MNLTCTLKRKQNFLRGIYKAEWHLAQGNECRGINENQIHGGNNALRKKACQPLPRSAVYYLVTGTSSVRNPKFLI